MWPIGAVDALRLIGADWKFAGKGQTDAIDPRQL